MILSFSDQTLRPSPPSLKQPLPYLGIIWQPKLRGDYMHMVGDFHVRYTDRPDGPLCIYADDDPGYYVLVALPPGREEPNRLSICGWIHSSNAKAHHPKQRKGEPPHFLLGDAWVVPRSDLRDFDELEIHRHGRVVQKPPGDNEL